MGSLVGWIVAVLLALGAAYAGACLVLAGREPGTTPVTPEELAAPVAPALPAGFLWGTATSSHQVEGGNTANDWWAFESEPGRIARGERSGAAVDHWNRMPEDVALMVSLGANAYRFSLEWSRLEPRPGVWDDAAWARYADLVRRLRAAGVEPMVTLHHFTLPRWLERGVLDPRFPDGLGRLAGEAARRLPGVTLWCTINEPNVLMFRGFVEGVWPPAVRDPARAAAAFAALLRAHARAAAELRAASPGARIGAAIHLRVFDPARRWFLPDLLVARGSADAFNWAFADAVRSGRIRLSVPGFPRLDEAVDGLRGSSDWLGVNYYTRDVVRFSPGAPGLVDRSPGPGPRTDLGWEIHPEGLHRLLRAAHVRYGLPIYVTENGIADARGTQRGTFLRAHAAAMARAAREGVPVLGYFHWSLLDNFEWADGFEPRFGLFSVDLTTFARRPAPGSDAFTALARGGEARSSVGGSTQVSGARPSL